MDPADLPRPALWPQPPSGSQPLGVPSRQGDEADRVQAGRSRLRQAWTGVGLMVLGAVLLGVAVIVRELWPLVAGLVVGAAGAAVAFRARIMDDVSDGDSPTAQ